ncbi:MAG: hypothetical protein KDA24_14565 [Deltaproteobacteria bacterium]|nr:hypothetical protein [Deltaproteobacteria bacterium]
MSRVLPIVALTLALSPGCSDTCRVAVTHDIVADDVVVFSIQARLEGTTGWESEDLLPGRFAFGETRTVRVPPSTPWTLDLHATDGATRSWTRLDALVCDVPDEQLELTLTDADRDQPCTWTLVNDLDQELLSVFMRRSDTIAWTRELIPEQPLAAGERLDFAVDDDRPLWDVQARADGGTELSLWTMKDLGPCEAGAALEVVISGDPDSTEEVR